jgi:hypothetical protein
MYKRIGRIPPLLQTSEAGAQDFPHWYRPRYQEARTPENQQRTWPSQLHFLGVYTCHYHTKLYLRMNCIVYNRHWPGQNLYSATMFPLAIFLISAISRGINVLLSWWPRPTTRLLPDSVGSSDTPSVTSSAVSASASVSPSHVNRTWFWYRLSSTLSQFETRDSSILSSRDSFNVEDDSTRGIVYSSSLRVLATLELSYLKSILVIFHIYSKLASISSTVHW